MFSLKEFCEMPSLDLALALGCEIVWSGLNRNPVGESWYAYKDNGSRVLAVGHLDDYGLYDSKMVYHELGGAVESIALDDRLGVWGIVEVMQHHINADWLFTTDEEMGRSTAVFFVPHKQYVFAYELDRAGTDVALYQYYRDRKLRQALNGKGWTTTLGSYNDISDLNIGCSAANFGIGYHLQHSRFCYANLATVEKQMKRVRSFLDAWLSGNCAAPSSETRTMNFESLLSAIKSDPVREHK